MSDVGALDLALLVMRVVGYAGFVMLAGTLMFWVLVWPGGSHHRRLALMAIAGAILMFLATVATPLLRLVMDGDIASALPRAEGAAVIIRVAVLACLAGFLTDLLERPIIGARRFAAMAVVLLLTATLVLPADVGSGAIEQAGQAVASAAHLLGAATWLGGLAALTVVILAGDGLGRLERLVPRFSTVATVSLLVLVVSSAAQALDVPDDEGAGIGSAYSLLVVAKACGLVLMLMLADYARSYAQGMAFRRLRTPEQAAKDPTVRRLSLVLQTELLTGVALLVATSVLVMVRPGG